MTNTDHDTKVKVSQMTAASANETDSYEEIQDMSSKWRYSYVIFTGFYLLPFLYIDFNLTHTALKIGIYGVFLVVFFLCQRFTLKEELYQKELIIYTLLMLGIAVLATFITPGSSNLFWVPVFITSTYILNKNIAIGITVLIFACIVAASILLRQGDTIFLFITLATSTTLSIFGMFERQRRRYERRERKSRDQIENLAAIAERERIARDLHDILGHSLSSIALKAQLAKKLCDGKQFESAAKEIDEVAKITSETLSEVRQAVNGYKYQSINTQIETLLEKLRSNGFSTELQGEMPTLKPKVESTLILVLREAVTNILRHSQGKNIVMTINEIDHELGITIHNDGNVEAFIEGVGIAGMKERIHDINGALSIDATQGFGITITLGTTHD